MWNFISGQNLTVFLSKILIILLYILLNKSYSFYFLNTAICKLKAAFPVNWHQDTSSSCFPPTFEFLNSCFSWFLLFTIKMLLNNKNGLLNLLEFRCNILIVYFKQNMNLKIQMLAGKEAKTYFEGFLKISYL